MKEYSRKNVITKFIISTVIGEGAVAAMLIAGGGFSYFGDNVAVALPVLIFALLFMPFGIMSYFFMDWKKFLIGIIAPIPIISTFPPAFKALFYAFKAFISILKHEETFTVGKKPEENNE